MVLDLTGENTDDADGGDAHAAATDTDVGVADVADVDDSADVDVADLAGVDDSADVDAGLDVNKVADGDDAGADAAEATGMKLGVDKVADRDDAGSADGKKRKPPPSPSGAGKRARVGPACDTAPLLDEIVEFCFRNRRKASPGNTALLALLGMSNMGALRRQDFADIEKKFIDHERGDQPLPCPLVNNIVFLRGWMYTEAVQRFVRPGDRVVTAFLRGLFSASISTIYNYRNAYRLMLALPVLVHFPQNLRSIATHIWNSVSQHDMLEQQLVPLLSVDDDVATAAYISLQSE